jgi:ribosomal protein L16 Arg81 hydroxylase
VSGAGTKTLPVAVDARTTDEVVARMLGGTESFFDQYWRRKPLCVPGAGAALAGVYGVDDFLADVVATQPVPYVSVSTRGGNRVFAKHATAEDLRAAIREGGVSAVKASKYWHGEPPASWDWMRTLFGSLCRAVSMIYMTPARSEDVDLFLAGPDSTLGTHFDTTDVFTLQIFGERKWTVDEEVHLDAILALARDPSWHPAKEIGFQGATREITLRPGDTFYVPAYGVHSVSGVTWSVSLSLGLRAFNEIDVVENLLEALRMTHYLKYAPLDSYPESTGEPYAAAKVELLGRVRSLLRQLEGVALATLLEPLQLPPTLQPPGHQTDKTADEPAVLSIFKSGFALDDDSGP